MTQRAFLVSGGPGVPAFWFLWRLLFQGHGEGCFAGLCRIVESGTLPLALGGLKEKSLLAPFRQSGESGLSSGIGSHLQVQFVSVHEPISDMHPNGRCVNGRTV